MAAKRDRILPGTAKMRRYSFGHTKGVLHYGTESTNGILCYKIGLEDAERIESLGYRTVKRGTGYAYVYKP